MNQKTRLYLNIFYTIIAMTIVIAIYISSSNPKIKYVTVRGLRFSVETRDTDEGRRRGLSSTSPDYLCGPSSYRLHGGDTGKGGVAGCGVLFAWSDMGERVMWMKDMNYPIDMYWLDSDMRVVHSEYDVATSTYNAVSPHLSTLYGRGIQAQYVLETKVYK